MKTKIFFAIVFLAAWFGFAGPSCVSSNQDWLVMGWIIATIGGTIITVGMAIKFIQKIRKAVG